MALPHIPFLVMAWQGSPVYDIVEQRTGDICTTADCCAMACQSFFAVQHLHRRGVLHGDLKPGNMLWRDSEKILTVVDFGFSKLVHRRFEKNPSSYLYTPGYRSPELYNILCVSEDMMLEESMLGWDVFAWATVAAELLSKQPLFRPVPMKGITRKAWDELCRDQVQTWSRKTSAGSMYRQGVVRTWVGKNPEFESCWQKAFAVDLADCLIACLQPSLDVRRGYWVCLERNALRS